jgi:hypothetical protein
MAPILNGLATMVLAMDRSMGRSRKQQYAERHHSVWIDRVNPRVYQTWIVFWALWITVFLVARTVLPWNRKLFVLSYLSVMAIHAVWLAIQRESVWRQNLQEKTVGDFLVRVTPDMPRPGLMDVLTGSVQRSLNWPKSCLKCGLESPQTAIQVGAEERTTRGTISMVWKIPCCTDCKSRIDPEKPPITMSIKDIHNYFRFENAQYGALFVRANNLTAICLCSKCNQPVDATVETCSKCGLKQPYERVLSSK